MPAMRVTGASLVVLLAGAGPALAAAPPFIVVGPENAVFPTTPPQADAGVVLPIPPPRAPIVTATADGFLAGANEYGMGQEVTPLGPDGRPTAPVPVRMTDNTHNSYLPEAIVARLGGAIALWGGDASFSRHDATGTPLDTPAIQTGSLSLLGANASAVWTGQAHLVAPSSCGKELRYRSLVLLRSVGHRTQEADGSISFISTIVCR